MKQNKLRKLLLVLLMAVTAGAWAEDVVYKTVTFSSTTNEQKISSYTGTFNTTVDGFTVKVDSWNNNNNQWAFIRSGYKSSAVQAAITTVEPVPVKLTRVVVTVDAYSLVSNNDVPVVMVLATNDTDDGSFRSQCSMPLDEVGDIEFSVPRKATGLTYRLYANIPQQSKNGGVQVSKIVYYAESTTPVDPTEVAAPTISLPSGTYEGEKTVELTSADDYEIYYTTDGSEPNDQTGIFYESPLTISEDMTLKAICVDDDGNASPVAEATYEFTTKKVYVYKKITSINELMSFAPTGAAAMPSFVLGADLEESIKVAQNITAGSTYGWLFVTSATEDENGKIQLPSRNHEFTVEMNANTLTSMSVYVKDSYGRYMYQDETHNNFNVTDAIGETTDGFNWTAALNNDGTVTLTNVDRQKFIQYNPGHSSYGCYAEKAEGNVLPKIYIYESSTFVPKGDEPEPGSDVLTTMKQVQDAAEKAGSTATEITVKMSGWYVSATTANNFYLTDGEGRGVLGFKKDHGFTAGDKLSGTVTVQVQMYRGAAEIVGLNAETEGLTFQSEQEVPVIDMEVGDITWEQYSSLVKLENLTYDATSETFIDPTGQTITPYDTFKSGFIDALQDGYVYNLTGVVIYFNTTREIALLSTEDLENVQGTVGMIITDMKWATFVSNIDAVLPDGVSAYRADAIGPKGVVEMTCVANAGGAVPANTPVLLYSDTYLRTTVSGNLCSVKSESENGLLVGIQGPNGVAPEGSWVLQQLNGEVGFYKVQPSADGFTMQIPSGKAYLVYDGEISAVKLQRPGTTGIELTPALSEGAVYYDLSGRRVENPSKGIYIVNGKKVLR